MENIKAWVVSVEMGYGHHRAAYALEKFSDRGILNADRGSFVSEKEKKLWKKSLSAYNFISRVKSIPVIGKPVFGLMDRLLHIPSFYPMRDLSQKTFQVSLLISSIKKGLCQGVLQEIQSEQIPMITSFYAPAIAADIQGNHQVFCIICDADINRVWVSPDPYESRIKYFAPCGKAAKRLEAYGVSKDKIFITGFPLPEELIGGKDLEFVKNDLGQRLRFLDPGGKFMSMHGVSVQHFLGEEKCIFKGRRPLTITYAVGGAGAQKEIAEKIIKSLKDKIKNKEIRINLIAGVRKEIFDYFSILKNKYDENGNNINICYSSEIKEYFNQFNNILRDTDILWTKPSELSFFCGLGIPIIMSPAIGSQEKFNRRWLREIGAGIKQMNPEYTDQWLFDYLSEGRLAEAAWSGFLKARKLGIYKIAEVLSTGKMEERSSPLMR